MKQSDLIIAMTLTHIIRRFLLNFSYRERNKNLEAVLKRCTKFLKHKEKNNFEEFVYAEEFERVLWKNVVDKYESDTPILAVDFVSSLHGYYGDILNKYVSLTHRLMLQFECSYSAEHINDDECREFEIIEKDLLHTLVRTLEPYSGIGIKKSLFTGKKLIIKNNMIIENVKVKEGF